MKFNKKFIIGMGLFGISLVTPLHAESGLPQFDVSTYSQQLFWLIVNFVVIYLFLKYVALPKFHKIKLTRNHRVLSQVEQSIKIKKEIEKLVQKVTKESLEAKQKQEEIFNAVLEKIKDLNKIKQKDLDDYKKTEQKKFDEELAQQQKAIDQQIESSTEEITKMILEKLNVKHMVDR